VGQLYRPREVTLADPTVDGTGVDAIAAGHSLFGQETTFSGLNGHDGSSRRMAALEGGHAAFAAGLMIAERRGGEPTPLAEVEREQLA